MIIKLKYGNTNTYFVHGLLIDTDYAGTRSAFYKEIKKNRITLADIKYILVTHHHPDHMGLVSELMALGTKLLLIHHQAKSVHFSDSIFLREPHLNYKPIDERKAVIIEWEESRIFLRALGIYGEIVPTVSHSADGIALILDDGNCFVGDLEPIELIGAYVDNPALQDDWNRILSYDPVTIHYGHANEKTLK